MNQQEWTPNSAMLPADGAIVMTKIHDESGSRNEQLLKRRGRLWYHVDEGMYVYYTPTHWRPCDELEREQAKKQIRDAQDRIPAVTSLTFG